MMPTSYTHRPNQLKLVLGGNKRLPKSQGKGQRHFNGVVIYTFWDIWNERNRRIFQNSSMDTRQRWSTEPKKTWTYTGGCSIII
jgi:hypothetical protein